LNWERHIFNFPFDNFDHILESIFLHDWLDVIRNITGINRVHFCGTSLVVQTFNFISKKKNIIQNLCSKKAQNSCPTSHIQYCFVLKQCFVAQNCFLIRLRPGTVLEHRFMDFKVSITLADTSYIVLANPKRLPESSRCPRLGLPPCGSPFEPDKLFFALVWRFYLQHSGQLHFNPSKVAQKFKRFPRKLTD